MSTFLDSDLATILRTRWQLVDGDEIGQVDRPFNGAWTRAQLVVEILDLFYDETKLGMVAGIATPVELDGLGTLRTAAHDHVTAMGRQMNAGA